VREIVIVIPDLFLPPGADAAAARAAIPGGSVPGLEYAGRFGARAALAEGWRAWLARHIGRADLVHVAPARVAAAALPAAAEAVSRLDTPRGGVWIATPVHLMAGLSRVHLEAHGILRLRAAELAALAAEFERTFGGATHTLYPLPSGQLLLFTAQMSACVTTEPARAAGGDLARALPQGAAGAALRRLGAEIEMWLHALPLNAERTRRGELPVTALWPWGAEGVTSAALQPSGAALRLLGSDPWLDGLARLAGADTAAPLPAALAADEEGAGLEVWTVALGAALASAGSGSLAEALARLDADYVSPALGALRRGRARSVTLLANDTRLTLKRHSALKRWRRARAGAGGLL
jgi:hypothetical protein